MKTSRLTRRIRRAMGMIAAIATLVLGASPSHAQSTVTLTATDQGWYDHTGYHSPSCTNHMVGYSNGPNHRDFQVFDLAEYSGSITEARLRVYTYRVEANNGSATDFYENLALYDVSTTISTLTGGGTGLTDVYADLGTGTTFGNRDVYASETNSFIEIPLNSAFLSAANSTSGLFAVGGAITTLSSESGGSGGEAIFTGAFADSLSNTQLVLSVVPEPGTLALCATGAASLLFMVWRRRKRRSDRPM